jgi:hypothetical protein
MYATQPAVMAALCQPPAATDATPARLNASTQGLTLVHFSAYRKRFQ